MSTSKLLQSTLRTFHLDNPEATWEELSARLKEIAEGVLSTPTDWEKLDQQALVYADMQSDLKAIGSTGALTVPQAKAVGVGQQVMIAAQEKLQGDSTGLLTLIDSMHERTTPNSKTRASVSLSVSATQSLPLAATSHPQAKTISATEPASFEALAAVFMEERKDSVVPSTMKNIKASCGVLSAGLAGLDMKTHTRADLITLRAKLMEGRKVSTVNKLLTTLSSVLGWAEANAYIDKAYDKKLQILKGAESERVAFTSEQVTVLMAHANGLPVTSWKRWALSLGVVTGARIGEIQQLTSKDLYRDDLSGLLVMDVNTNDGKTIKNTYSVRKVPVMPVCGLDVEALQAFGKAADGKLFKMSSSGFTTQLNQLIRDVLLTEAGTGLSFHSLRHHLAGAFKAAEVPMGTAQEVLGHSSGAITYDLYGSGRAVQVGRMAEALKSAFEVA